MTTATAKLTFGTVLGTVSDAATTVSSVFSAATKTVGMLDTYVTNAAKKQRISANVDMADYAEKLREEKSQEDATRKIAIDEFCAKSEEHKNYYAAAYNRIGEIIAKS